MSKELNEAQKRLVGTQPKFTVWTAPASTSAVAALVQLDMRAPITGAKLAKKRAANAKQRSQRVLKHFASTSSAESLRNDGRRQETQEGRCEVIAICTCWLCGRRFASVDALRVRSSNTPEVEYIHTDCARILGEWIEARKKVGGK